MNRLVFVFFLLSSVQSGKPRECGIQAKYNAQPGPMIVGGQPVKPGVYPWMVSLQQIGKNGQWTHYCGGSIIDENWVITAAHCIDDKFPGDIKIIAKQIELELIAVDFQIYPEFSRKLLINDMALIRITAANKLVQSELSTICLPPYDFEAFGSVTVAGWGVTASEDPSYPKLMEVELPLVRPRVCKSIWGFNRITSKMFCAGGEQGKDSCTGDSGGPAMQTIEGTSVLAGIVSYGYNGECGREGYPSVYTDVSKYLDFIYNTIR